MILSYWRVIQQAPIPCSTVVHLLSAPGVFYFLSRNLKSSHGKRDPSGSAPAGEMAILSHFHRKAFLLDLRFSFQPPPVRTYSFPFFCPWQS